MVPHELVTRDELVTQHELEEHGEHLGDILVGRLVMGQLDNIELVGHLDKLLEGVKVEHIILDVAALDNLEVDILVEVLMLDILMVVPILDDLVVVLMLDILEVVPILDILEVDILMVDPLVGLSIGFGYAFFLK